MLPLLGGVLSGSLGLMGTMFAQSQQNQFNQDMLSQSNQFNASQAQMNRDFQEQMSSSAYQRASKDMQAAGLNPMMMFGSGAAASSPTGAVATTQPAQKSSALGSIGPAMDRMVSSALSAKTFEKMVDEIANLKTTNTKIAAEAATERMRPALVREQTTKTMNEGGVAGHEVGIRRAASARADAEEAFTRTGPGRFLVQGAQAGRDASHMISPAGDVINSAVGVARGLSSHNFKMRWPDRYETTILPNGKRITKESIYSQ